MLPTDAHVGRASSVSWRLVPLPPGAALKYTTFGFAMTTVGSNPQAARYAGIWVQAANGPRHVHGRRACRPRRRLRDSRRQIPALPHFSPGYGFDGIVVAFMAAANPILVPIAALFFSRPQEPAPSSCSAPTGVDSTVIDAIQGLVVIFVAASLAIRFQDTVWAQRAGAAPGGEAVIDQRSASNA